VRATANSPCSGEWSDRWERERLRQNLLRPNLGFWRPQVTSGWLIGCKVTLVDGSEKKDKRGKTLTTVYQHHEQSYSSAHGGVRRQRGSICSRSFTVRFCQRCWFSSCQEASYDHPSPQSESFSERGSQRYSSVGFWTGKQSNFKDPQSPAGLIFSPRDELLLIRGSRCSQSKRMTKSLSLPGASSTRTTRPPLYPPVAVSLKYNFWLPTSIIP
jgi:hypothetical protein